MRKWVMIVTAVCAAYPASAQDNPPVSVSAPAPAPTVRAPPGRVVQGLIVRAQEMMADGQFAEALVELDDAASIAPDTPEIWGVRGTVLLQLRRQGEAVEAFDRADALAPDLPVTLRGRAFLAGGAGRFEEAVALFERALAMAPADPMSRTFHAVALIESGRAERAIGLADAMTAEFPDWFMPWALRVYALQKLERTDEAAAAVDAMVVAFPDNPDVMAAATSLLQATGRFDQADAMLDRSLATGETPYNLYESAMQRTPSEAAEKLRELTRALELAPDFTQALYERANTYWTEYRYREAMADVDRLIAMQPDFWGAYQLRGQILADQNRTGDVARLAAQLVADHPAEPDALAVAMFLYANIDQMTRARQIRTQLRAIAPDHYALDFFD